jgi:uncharacterized protein YjcR
MTDSLPRERKSIVPTPERPPKEELERLYVDEGLSAFKMAKMLETSHGTIKIWLMQYGLWSQERADANMKRGRAKPTPSAEDRKLLAQLTGLLAPDGTVVQVGVQVSDPFLKRMF